MNRLQKVLYICALLVAMLGTSLRAGPAAGVPAKAAVAAVVQEAAPLVTSEAPTLFSIGSFHFTNSIVYTWVVLLVLLVLVRISTRHLSAEKVPTGAGNVAEAIVEGWDSLMAMILDAKVSRWVFPFAVSFFLFALISNLMGLLPGVGSIGYGAKADPGTAFSSLPFSIEHAEVPLLRPPTADANMTVVMALIFLIMSLYWGLRYNGPLGLIKHVFGVKVDSSKWLYPLVLLMFIFVGFMETLSIVFVRPLALAIRLYGNIFAGESLLAMSAMIKPFILSLVISLPFYFYELFVAIVQAFVFAMLTIVFASTLCSSEEEDHGH